MTPRRAALQYAASLIDQQLAAAHVEYEESECAKGPDGRLIRYNVRTVLDTFAKAPPNVLAALRDGLDADEVAEAMAEVASELRSMDRRVLG